MLVNYTTKNKQSLDCCSHAGPEKFGTLQTPLDCFADVCRFFHEDLYHRKAHGKFKIKFRSNSEKQSRASDYEKCIEVFSLCLRNILI